MPCLARHFWYHIVKMWLKLAFVGSFFLVLTLLGCGRNIGGSFDGASGFVDKAHRVDADALVPTEVRLDAKHKNYSIIENFVFLARQDTLRSAVAFTFRRALKDNKFIRAERDFSGFILESPFWQALPYTKMRHEAQQLEQQAPFTFGGLEWTAPAKSGIIRYNWRGISLEMEFTDLQPVQLNTNGSERRRAHGIGIGLLRYKGSEIRGTVIYELIQLEGFNIIDKSGTGIEFTNYDWLAVKTESGGTIIASADSTTEGDRLLKNFVVIDRDGGIAAAEGSEHVRIGSAEIQRDRKIFEWLANRKIVAVGELGLDLNVAFHDARLFYTSGFAIAEVIGNVQLEGISTTAWGIVQHWQQPKADSEVLK